MKNIIKSMKKNYGYAIIAILLMAITILGAFLYKKNEKYTLEVENRYNLAFYELVDYMQNVEVYLAKAMISSTPESGVESLTNVWREANLAGVYLSQLPASSSELSKATKFLNQVSDYTYSLSKKSLKGEELSQEDLDNIKELHDYSIDLTNVLAQLATDMQNGRISWKELTKEIDVPFAQQVDNLSSATFINIDQNFGEYEGLIYDGAFSEHIEKQEKKGLTGNDIDEEKAKQIATDFIGKDKIKEITSSGLMENADIVSYDFGAKLKDGNDQNPLIISVSKRGGHVILMNYNRDVKAEVISQEDAKEIGKKFLDSKNITNMKATYYIKQSGFVTINYAYEQEGVVIYPDLVKVKVALDNGEIVGIETKGYLNWHCTRQIETPKISIEEAKKSLNENLEITGEKLAIIPTKWWTEVFCYEFTGKVDGMDFLVYINAETGEEENVLLIIDTPNGVLTQ